MTMNGSINGNNGLHTTTPNGITLLTFQIAGQIYGLPVTAVRQIIEMVTIIELPQSPVAVQGVINVRGQIVPVMDLRLRLGLDFMPYQLHTPIILVEVNGRILGLIVDEVETVLEITPNDMQTYDTIFDLEMDSTFNRTAFLSSVAKVHSRIVPILDVDRMLRSIEETKLAQLLADQEVFDIDFDDKPAHKQELGEA